MLTFGIITNKLIMIKMSLQKIMNFLITASYATFKAISINTVLCNYILTTELRIYNRP